ncbi:MAG: 3-phosphoshikimate 1-carboxyvinyltransferase [Pseudomonadota bacterium]
MVILHKKYTEKPQVHEDEPKVVMSKFPKSIRESFNDEQIKAIVKVSKDSDWKRHPVDIRFTIPFFTKRFYVVFIAGKSKRENKRHQNKIIRRLEVLLLSFFLTALFFLFIGLLYIIKSALGLDIMPDISLGIWDAIKVWLDTLFE